MRKLLVVAISFCGLMCLPTLSFATDCNSNGILDATDIAQGTSTDLNSNGVPDECDPCHMADVNCDGYVNAGDIGFITRIDNWLAACADAGMPRTDVNRDGMVNDFDVEICGEPGIWLAGTGAACECDVPVCAIDHDCNSNGIPDSWDIAQGTSVDCNTNGIPDDCDIANSTSTDCDTNSVPDDCQWDCDGDGIADVCELVTGMATDCDGNGFPDNCDLTGGFGFRQWADSVIAFSSQWDEGGGSVSYHATQALGAPNVLEHGDDPLAWAPYNADSGTEYLTLGFPLPVYATGATVIESYAPGFVTQIDAVDMSDQLHTVWTGTDTTACSGPLAGCEIGELTVTWTATAYLVKGLKVTFDTTNRTGAWEAVDAVALHGDLPMAEDCNTNGTHDACETDCNTNGRPDDCDITGGTSLDSDTNGIPDECQSPEMVFVSSMAEHTGVAVDLGIAVDLYPGVPNVEPRQQAVSGLALPYIRVEFNKPLSSTVNGVDVTPAGFGQTTATANLAAGDSYVVLITLSGAVTDQSCFTFDLAGLQAADGSAVGDSYEDTDFCICYIEGDSTGSGAVDALDQQYVQGKSGLSVQLDDNRRADLNRSGVIDTTDESVATAASGNYLSAPCYDCNTDGIVDSLEVAAGTAFDCNLNGRPDECDIAYGTSEDANTNGIPDECPHVFLGQAIFNGINTPIRDDGYDLITNLGGQPLSHTILPLTKDNCCLMCAGDSPPEVCSACAAFDCGGPAPSTNPCESLTCANACESPTPDGVGGCSCEPTTPTSCDPPPPPIPGCEDECCGNNCCDNWICHWLYGCGPYVEVYSGDNAHVAIHTGSAWTKVPLIQTYVHGETELGFSIRYESLNRGSFRPVGAGWRHSYQYRVEFHTTWDYSENEDYPGIMVFTDKDGLRYFFNAGLFYVNGAWTRGPVVAPPGAEYDITWYRFLASGPSVYDYHFTITKADGSTVEVGKTHPAVWTDARGQSTTMYPRDVDGNVSIVGPSGREITLHYSGSVVDSIIHPDSVLLPNGHQSRWTELVYEDTNYYRLSDIVHHWVETEEGQVVEKSARRQYEYDNYSRMTEETLENGTNYKIVSSDSASSSFRQIYVCTECGQDPADYQNVVTITCAEGFPDSGDSEMTAGTIHLLDGEGKEWIYYRDARGRITQVDDPLDNSKEYSYQSSGYPLLTQYKDELDRTTTYAYNDYGRATQITDASSNVTVYSYEDQDNPTRRTKMELPGGREYTFQYNSRGDVTHIFDAINEQVAGSSPSDRHTSIDYEYWANNIIKTETITDRVGNKTKLEYDSQGNLTQITEGYEDSSVSDVREYAYDLLGRVTSETVNRGDRTTVTEYSYDWFGRPVSLIVDPGEAPHLALTTRLDYDDHGKLIQFTNPESNVTEFSYDRRNRLYETTIDAGTGNLNLGSAWTLDGNGRVLTSTNPNGDTTTFTYDDAGRLDLLVDGGGYTTDLTADAAGNVTRVETWADADLSGTSVVVASAYDSLNRLTNLTVAPDTTDVQTTVIEYDAASGSSCGCTAMPGSDKPHKLVDSQGHTTYFYYDKMDRVTSIVRKVGDADDNEGDGDDAVILLEYDAEGNITKITDPKGLQTVITYDSAGRRDTVTVVDPAGPDLVTDFEYDGASNLIQVTFPNGNVMNMSYDGANRMVQATDNEGLIVLLTYDANGNVVQRQDANSNAWVFEYDGADRPTKVFDPLVEATDKYTQFVYDLAQLSQVINNNGVITKYEYDGLDRLLRVYEDFGGVDQRVTRYAYNGLSQLLSLTDHDDNETSYTYDLAGRLQTATYPDDDGYGAGTVNFSYDRIAGNHNRTIRTDQKGVVATLTYDELKNLVSRVFVDGGSTVLSETYAYDKAGHMLEANNDFAEITNVYDGLGRVSSTTQEYVADSLAFVTQLSYAYSTSGGTRTITYPGLGGRVVAESYDTRGRLTNVSGGTSIGATWTFDEADRRTGATLGNNVTSVIDYDVNDRLTSITHASQGGTTLFDVDYGYDAVGNRLYSKNNLHTDRSQQYVYDRLDRLTGFRRGTLDAQNTISDANILNNVQLPGKREWTLDKRGNWTSLLNLLNGGSSSETRTANGANEYLSATQGGTPQSLEHDANGNLTLDPLAPNAGASIPDGQRYEYDAANRLVKVWRTNGTAITSDDLLVRENKYDALGRRVETCGPTYVSAATGNSTVDAECTRWVFLGLSPIHEYDTETVTQVGQTPAMTLSREYIWGVFFPEPVAMIDHTSDGDVAAGTPEVLHYLHDVLGSVVALTNASGVVVERYDYDPYGKTYITDSTLTTYRGESKYGNPFMWTGQAFDQNARQYHFWARAYSPHLGRWLQRDPLGYVDGVSLYEYVCSDPMGFVDSLGLYNFGGLNMMHTEIGKKEAGMTSEELAEYQRGHAMFGVGMVAGLGAGAGSAIHGIATALASPLETRQSLIDGLAEFMAAVISEGLGQYVGQIISDMDASIRDWENLSMYQQGEALGRLIGKFGTDLLLPGGFAKLLKHLRALKAAKAAKAAARRAAGKVEKLAAKSATGQQHHAISKTVADALDEHPNLKGKYTSRDPRFVTQAKDAASHRGYQKWHRDLDDEVVEWLEEHQGATQKQFEKWLRDRYNKPDLKDRFPNGCP